MVSKSKNACVLTKTVGRLPRGCCIYDVRYDVVVRFAGLLPIEHTLPAIDRREAKQVASEINSDNQATGATAYIRATRFEAK